MAGQKAGDAFIEWVKANTTKIHADAIDEAAMGFAAGWDAQEAQVKRLWRYVIHEDGCLGRIHKNCSCGLDVALATSEEK